MDNSSDIILKFQFVTDILGTDDVKMIVLSDEDNAKQFIMICDDTMAKEINLRLHRVPVKDMMLPEVLYRIIQAEGEHHFHLVIGKLDNGNYLARLIDNDTNSTYTLRASDALLFSIVSGLPLHINRKLFMMQSSPFTPDGGKMGVPLNSLNIPMLEKALKEAVDREEYDMASFIRDELKRRKENNDMPK